ncbi:MAG TPA: PIN domain-containing protein, partial [Allosphingosinicella sp.]|nr:PIN domain-containing protein [Allosphingosinicella sp.]
MVSIAVLDANVLFPMILRDTLLRVAAAGCFRAHWSDRILDEMVRNLTQQHRITPEQAERLVAQMAKAFPEAEVDDR